MTAQEDLTPEEKAAFESLATHQIPPFSLEDQVVSALKNEGLIEKKKTLNNKCLVIQKNIKGWIARKKFKNLRKLLAK